MGNITTILNNMFLEINEKKKIMRKPYKIPHLKTIPLNSISIENLNIVFSTFHFFKSNFELSTETRHLNTLIKNMNYDEAKTTLEEQKDYKFISSCGHTKAPYQKSTIARSKKFDTCFNGTIFSNKDCQEFILIEIYNDNINSKPYIFEIKSYIDFAEGYFMYILAESPINKYDGYLKTIGNKLLYSANGLANSWQICSIE